MTNILGEKIYGVFCFINVNCYDTYKYWINIKYSFSIKIIYLGPWKIRYWTIKSCQIFSSNIALLFGKHSTIPTISGTPEEVGQNLTKVVFRISIEFPTKILNSEKAKSYLLKLILLLSAFSDFLFSCLFVKIRNMSKFHISLNIFKILINGRIRSCVFQRSCSTVFSPNGGAQTLRGQFSNPVGFTNLT